MGSSILTAIRIKNAMQYQCRNHSRDREIGKKIAELRAISLKSMQKPDLVSDSWQNNITNAMCKCKTRKKKLRGYDSTEKPQRTEKGGSSIYRESTELVLQQGTRLQL